MLGCSDGDGLAHLEPVAAPSVAPQPSDWARRVEPARSAAEEARTRRVIRPAVMGDESEARDDLVTARRLVYRVAFVVPPSYRHARAPSIPAAAELEVDLSRDRLRARFVGAGWPITPGAEVRVRTDLPGVYLFDAAGGRSLGPGELASWFEGRSGGSHSRVRVRRETTAAGVETAGPSDPICLLLAEWTAQERQEVAPRCSDGSIPPTFGFGPWRGELTAMVPLELPRRALRADAADPPPALTRATSGTMLGREDLAALVPARVSPDAERGTLKVENHGESRVIVVVDGIPIGWVDSHATATFEGLRTGTHRVGALRPLGVAQAIPRATTVPGTYTIGRAPRAGPDQE